MLRQGCFNMRHWAEAYVGLPYGEFDCAELCIKVCREQFEKVINLPGDRAIGIRGISEQICDLQNDFAISTLTPDEGDAVLMIGRGRLNHIGIACYINEQLYVLHAMRNVGMTVLHNISALPDVGLTVEGYYKWK